MSAMDELLTNLEIEKTPEIEDLIDMVEETLVLICAPVGYKSYFYAKKCLFLGALNENWLNGLTLPDGMYHVVSQSHGTKSGSVVERSVRDLKERLWKNEASRPGLAKVFPNYKAPPGNKTFIAVASAYIRNCRKKGVRP